ncbi:hypothetical protein CC80DRAFT_197708 [Byssothecium circinans]|uniref:Uncharacterized protein n=1 Tax=Byssothecium circinans TaxID=147558 RepID=A0A6A5UA60_9PLEO|nr:hypothetical protein CC80DRAFT_197708 [Byssothecium circinans]
MSPRLGRVARWYLPAMAAIAIGITYLPENFLYEPSPRTVTLGEANRRITYTVAAHLNQHNTRANAGYEPTQEERNQMMLNSYGDRSSLEDMEKAIAGYEANFQSKTEHEKRAALEEAYGERSSLKHLRKGEGSRTKGRRIHDIISFVIPGTNIPRRSGSGTCHDKQPYHCRRSGRAAWQGIDGVSMGMGGIGLGICINRSTRSALQN